MKKEVIGLLERALNDWEGACVYDFAFIQSLRAIGDKLEPPKGPLLHYKEFRTYLLGLFGAVKKGKTEFLFDKDRFEQKPERMYLDKPFLLGSNSLASIPVALFCWTVSSRRVYKVNQELQQLFDITSLSELCWQDVPLPFDSFVIELERPIELKAQIGVIECPLLIVFVAAEDQEDSLSFNVLLLGERNPGQKSLDRFDRQQLEKAVENRNYHHVRRMLETLEGKAENKVQALLLHYDMAEVLGSVHINDDEMTELRNNVPNESDCNKFLEEYSNTIKEVSHLVASLCVYLTSLPSDTKHVSGWKKIRRESGRPDPHAILNEAEVCIVTNCHNLTKDDLSGARRKEVRKVETHSEKSCHFRCAHWRKKPGTGHDPNAPKNVWVGPCLVRPDRLLQNSIPGGSVNKL